MAAQLDSADYPTFLAISSSPPGEPVKMNYVTLQELEDVLAGVHSVDIYAAWADRKDADRLHRLWTRYLQGG